ncbi:solute carrier family 22 member 21-like [Styela clava]
MAVNEDCQDVTTWGKYQLRLSSMLILSSLFCGVLVFHIVFTSYEPKHRCYIPELDEENSLSYTKSNTTVKNESAEELNTIPPEYSSDQYEMYIPREDNETSSEFSSCEMYNQSTNFDSGKLIQTTNCKYGYFYEEGKGSTVTEWDLVCDRAWIKPLTASIMLCGSALSSLTVGWIADRYGRQKIFLMTILGRFIWLFICAFSTNPWMFAATIFFVSYCNMGSFVVKVVLVSEMLSARNRTIVVNLLYVAFALGYMILPVMAYITPSWRWLLGSISVFGVIQIPCIWWVPESYRWLIQRGQRDRANKLRREIELYNGYTRHAADLGNLTDSKLNDSKSEGELYSDDIDKTNEERFVSNVNCLDLFRASIMRNRLFINFFTWLVLNITYYFFSLNTSNLGGSAYINCFLAGAVEIPAAIVSFVFMRLIGRKYAYVTLGMTSALAIILTPFAISWNTASGVTIAMIGKFSITSAYDVMYLYTPEMFPTLLRSVALGTCTFSGNVGAIISPYIVYASEKSSKSLPYLVMAGLTFITVCLVLLLPETKNVKVPDTIEEAKQMKIDKLFCINK